MLRSHSWNELLPSRYCKKHYGGKDNLSLRKLIKKHGIQYKAFSKKLSDWAYVIKYRDSFICKICGKKPKDPHFLQAHHIHAKFNHPELKYELKNGVTLCHWCHKTVDKYMKLLEKIYGRTCKI